MSIKSWMFTLLILLVNVFAIHGSHFDGGSISYQVVGTNGSKVIVRITQSYTYVYSKVYCNNTYIANQWSLILTGYADATAVLNCTANCTTDGGYTPIPVDSKCTDYSVGMGITVGQRTDDVALDNGSYFVISNQGNAFRTLSLPGSGGSTLSWSISALIDLRMRPDGTYNTSPKATMISPVYIPVGIQEKISIPTIDANNDNVRCRFANGTNECGAVCPPSALPTGTAISSNCTLTITGTKAGDWYAVALQAEDFANTTTTTPYSSVPVQFLVYVYALPACTQRPYLYGPSLDGSCTGVEVGVPYTLTLYAVNYCSSYGVTMVDIATQSFPIVIKTPIVQNTSTLWSVSLTWTPTPNEVGSQVFCSVGVDSQSVQTNQYCLTFTVGSGTLGNCPGAQIPTTTEETTTAALTTEALTTEALTTKALTTEALTTEALTTEALTTEALTTEALTTEALIMEALTTEALIIEALTTESSTTTATVANTTVANNTSSNTTPVIVTVIIIPICCCCCCGWWWLYYCCRPCRMVDVEEAKKPVTTYTIEGAYMYKDDSLISEEYHTNDNDTTNTAPLTDTSYLTWHETSLNSEPMLAKSFSSMSNDLNLSLPSIRQNVPASFDTESDNTDRHKMLMHHDPFSLSSSIPKNARSIPNPIGNNIYDAQTTNYDRYPPRLATQINTASTPATITSNIYRENIQHSIDPRHFKSLSRPKSASSLNFQLNDKLLESNTRPKSVSSLNFELNDKLAESNARPATRPWTKHPRWVTRLSQPKRIHTGPLSSTRPLSREGSDNKSISSGRSTSTIPRYAFYEE